MVLLLVSNGFSKANGQALCFAAEGNEAACTTAGVNLCCDGSCKKINPTYTGICEGSTEVHCHCYKPCV
ncbi:hypothetical protein EUTSA_v10015162mg [Eutrema salsugineum]|uniref:Knottin scorpion toxin-like domain-containing protein n=2 Tax=Eutrema salsugineum TaxID=72664 RepID=V4N7V6_EUTSA|nr:hypothetical protein EUTSA_v10015162mg [Eutrema salsugineum]